MQNIDVLNRQPFIDNVINLFDMISKDKRGCVFAIDGDWGTGKSFILEQIEKQVENIQSEETYNDRYYLFHYNCWQYDYYTEPAVAIISAMLDKANSMTTTKISKKISATWKVAKDILSRISGEFVKNKIGIDVVEIANSVLAEEERQTINEREFDEWFSFKRTLDDTRTKIQEIATEKTVLIFVDELDRCLPQYAIKVIERLHHIFDGLENVIVVLAIDSSQLNHSIEEIFGQGTDAEKYLKKFISFKLKLDYGNIQDNVWDKYSVYFEMFNGIYYDDENEVRNTIQKVFDAAQFDIREKEKIIEKATTIQKLICDEKCDYSIMLLEMFIMIFATSRKKNGDAESLDILASINSSNYVGLGISIGTQLLNTFKSIEKSCRNGTHHRGTRNFIECESSVAVAFCLLNEIYSDKDNTYGDPDIEKYKKEIEICKRFERYRKLLE